MLISSHRPVNILAPMAGAPAKEAMRAPTATTK
jgi:hypothetical protein